MSLLSVYCYILGLGHPYDMNLHRMYYGGGVEESVYTGERSPHEKGDRGDLDGKFYV